MSPSPSSTPELTNFFRLIALCSAIFVTIFGSILYWDYLEDIVFTYEAAVGLLFFLSMYPYVTWLLRYHEPLIKAQNLLSKDMMRRMHFEAPQFIEMGFKDLQCNNEAEHVWQLKHKNFAFYASQGKRDYMEDRMHYMHDPAKLNLSIFSIFDGHGGPYVCEFLERNFAHGIRQRLLYGVPARRLSNASNASNDSDPFESVREAIVTEVHKIDDEISRLDKTETSNTGSTLISAILEQNRYLTVINVGDARAVACDLRGKAIMLSVDHKPGDADERRRIENAGGYVATKGVDRVQGVLAVSRAFGDTALKNADVITAHPNVVRVDLTNHPLRYLIAASDGFFDVFDNQEAIDFANAFLVSKGISKWPTLAHTLTSEALRRGADDNVSVLIVKLVL